MISVTVILINDPKVEFHHYLSFLLVAQMHEGFCFDKCRNRSACLVWLNYIFDIIQVNDISKTLVSDHLQIEIAKAKQLFIKAIRCSSWAFFDSK